MLFQAVNFLVYGDFPLFLLLRRRSFLVGQRDPVRFLIPLENVLLNRATCLTGVCRGIWVFLKVIHIRRCCQDERAAHSLPRYDIAKVKRSLMYVRLRCYPGGKFELSTDSLDGLLRGLAQVSSLTGAGANEGDAAATHFDSGSSGNGSGCSALSGGFCIGSIGATPATPAFAPVVSSCILKSYVVPLHLPY